MRTTINLKDEVINEAIRVSHISNKTELIHLALKNLIAEYARLRLVKLGGTEKGLEAVPRR